MGPTTKGKSSKLEQTELFEDCDNLGRPPKEASTSLIGGNLPASWRQPPPIQTSDKSKLISEYLANFQKVTGGGVYIDGFAAPQSRKHEDAWTARRVLDIRPNRLRCFWLCDIDPEGIGQLKRLKASHHNPKEQKRVFVVPGDFNKEVNWIVKSHRIHRKTAVFALLDQRNTECHWATVKTIASRKGNYKVEMMYFVGVSWLHRSLSSSKTSERIEEINLWWGGSGWRDLLEMSQMTAVKSIADRFKKELHYKYVNYYPVFQDEDQRKTAFFLIHASDHPEAPKLMTRAYVKIFKPYSGHQSTMIGDDWPEQSA